MPIRVSGMNSGLDTESIVSALVSGYKVKVDNSKKAQTKLSWKQEAWKDVNKKVYSLYTGLDKVRRASSFNIKKTSVSDPTKATVSAKSGAIDGTQTLSVKKLAAAGYMTGNKLKKTDDSAVTKDTTLAELGISGDKSGKIEIGVGDSKVSIDVNSETTVKDFVEAINNAKDEDGNAIGVQANFDANNGRIFISSKKTGAANDFTISGTDDAGKDALAALGLGIGSRDAAALASAKSTASAAYVKYGSDGLFDADATRSALTSAFSALKSASDAREAKRADFAAQSSRADGAAAFKNLRENDEEVKNALGDNEEAKASWEKIKSGNATAEDYEALSNALQENELFGKTAADLLTYAGSDLAEANSLGVMDDDALDQFVTDAQSAKDTAQAEYNAANSAYNQAKTDNSDYVALFESQTAGDVDSMVNGVMSKVQKAVDDIALYDAKEPIRIQGSDAEIELNGATFTSSSNEFEVNGLAITASGLTGDNPITITTSFDAQGMYDKIKDWLSEYNSVMTDLAELYHADAAKGYEPLTDDEKAEMSDKEIEKWEEKVKGSLLRRDSTLDSIMNSMFTSMSKSFNITMKDGTTKNMALSNLGIQTAGYGKDKTLRYQLHINGDQDDDEYASKTDSLMAMINEDPDAVADLFSKLTQGLYDSLDTKMKSSSMSSAYTVYNDKQMNTEYSNYTKQIKSWETKMTSAEDRYFKQFTAMEKALANLNSSQSALGGMLGG